MLGKVEIKNYRGFPSYRMEGIAQVNLLVGKNNSGKTTLLEAIQFLASGGDPSVLDDAAQRRGELISPRPDRTPLVEASHLFTGHGLKIDSSFSVSGDNGHRPVTVRIVSSRKRDEGAEVEGERLRPSGVALKVEGGRAGEKDDRVFRLTREGGVDLEVPSRSRRLGLANLFEGPPVRFISTDSLSIARLAGMWDEITLNGLEGEVSKALQVLEPDVQSIHMLSGMSAYGFYGSRAGAVVGLKGSKQRIPLGSMGDGMRRMLALATSLACTREGALFADEIDTGLHYSIMSDMWKLIVDRAVAANVQVFATTHSWDCIEGLSLLCQQDKKIQAKVAVHKIDRSLQHSIAFNGESVGRMERNHIDPR